MTGHDLPSDFEKRFKIGHEYASAVAAAVGDDTLPIFEFAIYFAAFGTPDVDQSFDRFLTGWLLIQQWRERGELP